jgi:hypothetical protein
MSAALMRESWNGEARITRPGTATFGAFSM